MSGVLVAMLKRLFTPATAPDPWLGGGGPGTLGTGVVARFLTLSSSWMLRVVRVHAFTCGDAIPNMRRFGDVVEVASPDGFVLMGFLGMKFSSTVA